MGYITVREASKRLKVKPRTIRAWIRDLKETDPVAYKTHTKREEIPFYRIGRAYRLDPGEVLQALKQGKKE